LHGLSERNGASRRGVPLENPENTRDTGVSFIV
jgi:hypothetical protein